MPFRRKKNRVSVTDNKNGEVLSHRSDEQSGAANKTRTSIFGRIFHCLFRLCSLRSKRNSDSCTGGEEVPNVAEEPPSDSSLYDALRSDTQTSLPNIQEAYEGPNVANSTNDNEVHDDKIQAQVRDDIQEIKSLNELPSIRKNLVLTSMCDSAGSDLTSLPSIEEIDMFNNLVTSYHQCKAHNERDILSKMKLAKTFTSLTKPLIKITESVSCDNVNESRSNTSAENKTMTSSKSNKVTDVSDKNVEAKLSTPEMTKITSVSTSTKLSSTTSKRNRERSNTNSYDKNNAKNGTSSSKITKRTKAGVPNKGKLDSRKSQKDDNNNDATRVTANKQNVAGASKKCQMAPNIAAKTTTLVKQNGTVDVNGTKSRKWSWMQTKQFKSLNSILTRKIKKVPMTSLVPVVINGVSVHLGNGAYGSVDLMKLTSRHGEVRAAVKTIKQPATKVTLSKKERVMERALMEAQCLHLLSASRVFPKVYGICYPKVHEIKIIMEFIGRGNNSIELTDAILDPNGIKAGITWLRITKDITCGLDFMHRKGLLHNDLAPRNILLTSEQRWCAKIIDLGMVSSVNAPSTRAYDFCDTPENIAYQKEKWPEIAPEFLEQEDQPETKASDVYSLGMIFGKIGYAKKIPGLQEIAMNMVVRDPNCRSSTSVILKRLNRLISVELKGRSVRVSGKGSNVALHKFFKKV